MNDHSDPEASVAWIAEIAGGSSDSSMLLKVFRLGRTIGKRAGQIVAWHQSQAPNGPIEAINNLTKLMKRTASRLRQFARHRIGTSALRSRA